MIFKRGRHGRSPAIAALAMSAVLVSGCSWIGLSGDGDDVVTRQRMAESALEAGSAVPLRPGDQIRVSSWREEGLTDQFVVDEDGTVVLPLLGPRNATSKPADEFKRELVTDYESRFRDHTVGVTLLRRVSILGAVQEPGVYHVDPTMSVSEAVALAGGPTPDGKMDEVTIHRQGQEIETELSQAAPLQAYVRSGDQIVVPQRSWFARNSALLVGSALSAATIIMVQFF